MTRLPPRNDHRQATEVSLIPYLNNTGITHPEHLLAGAFNIWGNTFPADELPAGPSVMIDGIPFLFPAHATGGPDNVRCEAQLVDLPVGRYDWIQLLCAAERRTEDPIWLYYEDGTVESEWLRVSDFWPQTEPRFGEIAAFRLGRMHYPRHVERRMAPVIWRQRLPVPRPGELSAVRLPDNPAIHLFAVTLLHTPAPAVIS
ncbi:hypothetical protein [Streptosporangium sp. CA-115845]|uniref:hypothetical protein n=1 Tax=Streptosporangium sp. CA-115845 TaxID=3240071 RepID=UPI003D8DBE95